MAKKQIGLVGLAVMGENLALNIESRGYSVAVFNRTTSKVTRFVENRCRGKDIVGCYSPQELCASLQKPRKIILMVKAGEAVDAMIGKIRPYLDRGDLLIDGGNSHFRDTERRLDDLAADGILYIGTGVSGGEEGALQGPCIMPGGSKKAYHLVKGIFEKAAAQVDGPCCTYIGDRGAGHFVKMVHNGIEYGIMQAIAEVYHILGAFARMTPEEMSETFANWNRGEFGGYLTEITVECLARKDEETGQPLVDVTWAWRCPPSTWPSRHASSRPSRTNARPPRTSSRGRAFTGRPTGPSSSTAAATPCTAPSSALTPRGWPC